jgi:hypothetical protein
MWFSIYRTDWQHASASRAPLANCPFWLQLARRPSGSDIEPGTFGTKVEAADPREEADRWQLAHDEKIPNRAFDCQPWPAHGQIVRLSSPERSTNHRSRPNPRRQFDADILTVDNLGQRR